MLLQDLSIVLQMEPDLPDQIDCFIFLYDTAFQKVEGLKIKTVNKFALESLKGFNTGQYKLVTPTSKFFFNPVRAFGQYKGSDLF